MKLSVRLLSFIPCTALLFAAVSTAHAQYTVNGSVWENGTTDNVPAAGSSIYSTTPTATFTVGNSSASSLFSFTSSNDVGLSAFLTSGGDSLTYATGSGAAGDNINNDLFQFTGTTTLVNGTTYTFGHDDGLLLYLNGNLAINQGGPTSYTTTDFTVCSSGCDATGGTYSFVLDYAEVAGPPADLVTNLPLTSVTPEPSSLILLGTGLVMAAGVARRRMKI